MARIAIIDYGVGNLRSVEKAIHAADGDVVVTSDEKELRAAEKLVLPGVGAFKTCMSELQARGFDKLVLERVGDGTPLLGVCVGMQMLFESSEEFGDTPGLGIMKGKVRRFAGNLQVPHVGWNQIEITRANPLLNSIGNGSFFYFVHSYYCEATDEDDVIGKTEYGGQYASVVSRGKVCGVQFHPEKSQDVGLKLLRNFALNSE